MRHRFSTVDLQQMHIQFTCFSIEKLAQSGRGNYDSFPFHADYAVNLS